MFWESDGVESVVEEGNSKSLKVKLSDGSVRKNP